ncbi:MAG: type III-A CRISPR-associated RAMP protein Csm3 [Epsilonproteobacteria bacterium]|nr:type III-A CRISPR-associated RAMP protein Csm3 [Campylobacterota bacterium]NPA89769.1 type III-A CRISPR-associated RAMP protein Csm3 [Campylobacterota bacterium]
METKPFTEGNILRVVTGLHIGGGKDTLKIGGIDTPVIKRTIWANKESGEVVLGQTGGENIRKLTEPYIPGSSLKGKIRSLLEHYFGLVAKNIELERDPSKAGKVIDSEFLKKLEPNDLLYKKGALIILLFGESGGNKSKKKSEEENREEIWLLGRKVQMTRFIFRDCYITDNLRKEALEEKIELTEEKIENAIDRVYGTTSQKGGGLRTIERVPSGIEFNFDVGVRIFEEDKEKIKKEENGENEEKNTYQDLYFDVLKLGIALLHLDYLGGNGSRGYGQVRIGNYESGKFKPLRLEIENLNERIQDFLNSIKKPENNDGTKSSKK